jgi:hypothetical protein
MESGNLTQIHTYVARRLKSGLKASGRLSASADNPSFKNLCAKSRLETVPAWGRAAQAIPFQISSPARLGAGEEAKERGLRPQNRIHSANDSGQS